MAKEQTVNLNTNRNEVEVPEGLEFEGKKILKVMHALISEENEDGYMCILEDGEKAVVPAHLFVNV